MEQVYIDTLYPSWTPRTIWTHFLDTAKRFPNRDFCIYEAGTCSYSQARGQICQIARSLLALGIRPGDHVATLLHNCPEFVMITFALAAIGAVRIPVNANAREQELAYALKHARAQLLFSEKPITDETAGLLKNFSGTVLVNCSLSPPRSPKHLTWTDFLARAAAVPEQELHQVSENCQDPYAVSDIMFTSGSTAKPKGVLLTHDMLLRSSFATCRCRNMEDGRRIFVPVPLFHMMAYNEALLPAIYVGGAIILTTRRYDANHCLDMMRRWRANDIVCVSSIMMDMLTKCSPRPEDFPDMTHGYWASYCPKWIWQAGRDAFGLKDICTGYGMTECGSTTSMTTVFDPPDRVRHCHGRLKQAGAAGCKELDGHLLEIRICGPDGCALSPGEIGEICCRGATVTQGYYNNPEANAKAFTRDGWFKTGDMGHLDADGYLTFCGRNSDMYKVNGENVSPQFVEEVIGTAPMVNTVAVVGVPHPKCGEVGVAFVDASDISPAAQNALAAYCKEHLAGFQIPEYFIFSQYSQWPRTSSGKVEKAGLRAMAQTYLRDTEDRKQP